MKVLWETLPEESLNTGLLNIQEDQIHWTKHPKVQLLITLFKTLVLSTSNVWTILSMLLFSTGKFQAFAHLDCNTHLKFEPCWHSI